MTAFTAIEKMVRQYADSDLRKDENIKKMVNDIDHLDEIDSGEERAEQRELLAQHIVNYLVTNNYLSESDGFDLLNKENPEYGYQVINDVDTIDDNDCDEDELEERDQDEDLDTEDDE